MSVSFGLPFGSIFDPKSGRWWSTALALVHLVMCVEILIGIPVAHAELLTGIPVVQASPLNAHITTNYPHPFFFFCASHLVP